MRTALRELVQTGGDRSVLLLVGIVITVRRDGQMSQVERPQIAVEDFAAQRKQAIEESVQFP